jgi:hypothetical protein
MKDPSAEMQRAIHAKLVGSSALATAMGGTARVFDKVEASPTYPYIRIGDDQAVDVSNGCFDAWDFFATLHIFSRHTQGPRMEAKAISNAAVGALATFGALPTPSGFKVSEAEVTQARTFFETDGVTAHGVVTIRFRVLDGA